MSHLRYATIEGNRRGSAWTDYAEKFFISLFVISFAILVSIIEGEPLFAIFDQSKNLYFTGLGGALIAFLSFRPNLEGGSRRFFRTLLYSIIVFFFCMLVIIAIPHIENMLRMYGFMESKTSRIILNKPARELSSISIILRNAAGVVCLLTGITISRAFDGDKIIENSIAKG
jgi:Na+/proline symporter